MKRRGVSLMEVLFAIGVIAIGLLGVTAILPIALHQAGRGHALDRAARIAADAEARIRIWAMDDWNNWIRYNPSAQANEWVPASAVSTNAFAIDPRFFSKYYSAITPSTPAAASQFPYSATSGMVSMARITLAKGHHGLAAASNTKLAASSAMMTAGQADLVFVASDDLRFDIPADKSLPPASLFARDRSQFPEDIRREFDGEFSWMATIAPKLQADSTAVNDLFVLSIVVFHRRDPLLAMDEVAERVVTVKTFHNAGYGGGEITLEAATPDLLEVRTGDWIMLMAAVPSSGSSLFRWFRVMETDETIPNPNPPPSGPNTYVRDVSLQGSDWPSSLTTHAAIISNVILVHEKTIHLQTSSL